MSLKESVKLKIKKEIEKISAFKTLIVDKKSLFILNSFLTMNEVLEMNITEIRDIEATKKGSTLLYFISNQLDSVLQLIKDQNQLPRDASIHLICVYYLSESLFMKIKNSPLRNRIESMVDLGIDFTCFDSSLFTFETPELVEFQLNEESIVEFELNQLAKRLVSMFSQLDEFPIIRYYIKPILFQTTRPKTILSRLAYMLQDLLEKEYQSREYIKERSTLILLDRNIDVMSLVLHDLSYQSLLADLGGLFQSKLAIPSSGGDSASRGGRSSKDSGKEEYFLDERDEIWEKTKSMHIGNVIDHVTLELNKFTSENKAAQFEKNGGNQDLEGLKDVVVSFQDYQETKKLLSKHLALGLFVSDKFKERGLEPIIDLEQQIVYMDASLSNKAIMRDLMTVLGDYQISRYDKLRLVLLYIISKNGISDQDRQTLIEHGQFSGKEIKSITNLSQYGVKLSPSNDRDNNPYNLVNIKKRLQEMTFEYENAKHVPILHFILQDFFEQKLDLNYFPFVGETVAEQPTRKKPTWASRKKIDKQPRVFVFNIGGVTYNELRTCDEIKKKTQREVYLGGSVVWTADSFVEHLKFHGERRTDFYGFQRPEEVVKNPPVQSYDNRSSPSSHDRTSPTVGNRRGRSGSSDVINQGRSVRDRPARETYSRDDSRSSRREPPPMSSRAARESRSSSGRALPNPPPTRGSSAPIPKNEAKPSLNESLNEATDKMKKWLGFN